jgi:uncharacterized membrane protein YccC
MRGMPDRPAPAEPATSQRSGAASFWRGAGLIRWPQLRLAVQTAFATVVTYGFVTWLALPQGYWSIMTAILVVQGSVGASLELALERLLATLLGAVVGVVAVASLEGSPASTFLGLFLAVVGLTYLSTRPSFRLAPVTAAIVILSSPGRGTVLFSAMERVLDIGLGTVIGVLTCLFLFPLRASEALVRQVGVMAPQFSEGFSHSILAALGEAPEWSEGEMAAYGARIRAGLRTAEGLTAAAQRELAGYLASHADPASLQRSLRRLWNTEVMALRTARTLRQDSGAEPGEERQPGDRWPPALRARLGPALDGVRCVSEAHFSALGQACADGASPPEPDALAAAVALLNDAVVEARRTGVLRAMSTDEVARLFALTFALEQLSQNLAEVSARCRDLRQEPVVPSNLPDQDLAPPDQPSSPSNSKVE